MKKQIIGFLFGVSITILLSFRSVIFTPSASTAEVNNVEGLYVFTDSRPVMPYDSIGFIEIGFVSDTQYESIRSSLIKKAKNKFPYADGIIMNFNKKGVDNCIVIDLKDVK
jgi:hypothetical protein